MPETIIVHPAQNHDPNPGPPGVKPYEMAGRREPRTPLFSFADVSGWEVEGRNAEGWLTLSQEQKLYREYCGKLVYVAKGEDPSLLVRPSEPITIPDPWDALNFWNYGNNWGWAPDPKTPPLRVAAVLRDANGWEFELPLGVMNYQYWFLMNGRLHDEHKARLVRPVQFVGFRFTNGTNSEPKAVYLGPCAFFEERLNPLKFDSWPETLPFPTRAETILPLNKSDAYENDVREEGETTVFTYEGPDAALEYRYTPMDGTLADIWLHVGERVIRPFADGGIELLTPDGAAAPDDPDTERTLTDLQLTEGTLRAVWHLRHGDVETDVEYRLRIMQKSLVIEIEASEPVVGRVALGHAERVPGAELVKVPYLTYGGNDPHVLVTDGLFLFAQFDWYVSDASELYGGAEIASEQAVFNGGARYHPKTDGTRNLVVERLFLTASPDFQEVLPTVPNPPSPMREVQGGRLWRVKSGADYAAEVAEARRFRAYGCDNVTIRYHENTWRDTGESFTFRLDAAPGKGGDEALRDFVSAVKALGWRVGLYTNYTDYAPVNRYWDEDWVNRLPNGDWQRAWMRCYAPKPMRAVEAEAFFAPRIHEKFGSNHSYCDVHTAVTPFSRVDYDARVPGAGMFRRTFECFGRILYNEKTAYEGPVYSEGRNHWWYAGLTDGNYAQIISDSPPGEPLLVDFDLLKLHPQQMDAGMGAPGMFFGRAEYDLDQFIATTVAYGHIGFLDWPAFNGALRIYYMIQPIQTRYAMVPVSRIEYEDGGRLIDTSAALVTGAHRRNRVHVVYENGTEVYVNGHEDTWTVEGAGRTFDLPKWGFLAWRPKDDLLVYSALVDSSGDGAPHRVEASFDASQVYADSHGVYLDLGPIALKGSAAIKRDEGDWWAIPATECEELAFAPSVVGMDDDRAIDVAAAKLDGSMVGGAVMRWSRGRMHLFCAAPKDANGAAPVKYRLRPSDRSRPPALTSDAKAVRPGGTISVQLPKGVPVDSSETIWERGGRRIQADVERFGNVLRCTVPETASPGERLWLGVPTAYELLWLDFDVTSDD